MVERCYCQVSVLVPFHFFALLEFVLRAFSTFIAAIKTPCSAAVTLLGFERLFSLKQSEAHLLFTFENHYLQKIYRSIFSRSSPKSIQIGKEKDKYTLECDLEFIPERNADILF